MRSKDCKIQPGGRFTWVFLLVAWVTPCLSQESEKREFASPGSVIQSITKDADAVKPLVQGEWTQTWLNKAQALPSVSPFTVQVGEKSIMLDESDVYVARYGSPIAYVRALEILDQHSDLNWEGSRWLDFGYGSLGHLGMMAACGAHVVGVDVAVLPEQTLASGVIQFSQKGSVKVLAGRFPADPKIVAEVADGYDVVISKNTLKLGYIHPARPTDEVKRIRLGVSDEEFLLAMHKILKSGGMFLIYNLCPAKAAESEEYVPWADGESPFTKEQWIDAGFEIVKFDAIDHAAARQLGHALGWDAGDHGMNLEHDLFAWYTLARKAKE